MDRARGRGASTAAVGSPRPEFGIYLVTGACGLALSESADLKTLELGDVPLFSEEDIVRYDWKTHELELTPAAFARLPSASVEGLPFVVVAGSERCYLGAFWTHFSSLLPRVPVCYTGPAAFLGRDRDEQTTATAKIRIEPAPIAGIPDPRGDERVRKALGSARLE